MSVCLSVSLSVQPFWGRQTNSKSSRPRDIEIIFIKSEPDSKKAIGSLRGKRKKKGEMVNHFLLLNQGVEKKLKQIFHKNRWGQAKEKKVRSSLGATQPHLPN